jgi:mannose-6-phosphate isomerase-like protein (cupin superfamily)
MQVINVAEKFSKFTDCWQPKIAGELNDSYVKLSKLSGEFVWHQHEREDELFLVTRGTLRMQVRENGSERELVIRPGEFLIVPHGVEHKPVADEICEVLLLEPKSTLNTGNIRNERTVEHLERI